MAFPTGIYAWGIINFKGTIFLYFTRESKKQKKMIYIQLTFENVNYSTYTD